MHRRPRGRGSVLRLVCVVLVSLVVVAILVTRDDPTPVIAGDSLVTQAAVWGGKVLHGTSVIASVGHDPCQDQAKIKHAGAKRPKRLVLAYTGNAYGPTTGQALALHGVQGLGLAYAGCLRHIRESVPDRVHVVVVQALACGPTDVHGSPVLNDYLRAATLGGTYPSGERVAPMRNASYSTAVDDRMTPGHRFRDRDEGGVLRSDDQVHLTVHGATVYAAVLTGLANGP